MLKHPNKVDHKYLKITFINGNQQHWFRQMAFRQDGLSARWPFGKMGFGRMAFGKMGFGKMAFGKMGEHNPHKSVETTCLG